ncbi:hypothetical protein LEMLEM_LOCUS6558 [Lemmus lemmus]
MRAAFEPSYRDLILPRPLDCKTHTCCIDNRSWTVPVSKSLCIKNKQTNKTLISNIYHCNSYAFITNLTVTYFYTGLFLQYLSLCDLKKKKKQQKNKPSTATLIYLPLSCYCDCPSRKKKSC